MTEQNPNRPNLVVGMAVLGGLVTGLAGVFTALFAFLNGDGIATGVSLGAAALAFGLIANAVLGH